MCSAPNNRHPSPVGEMILSQDRTEEIHEPETHLEDDCGQLFMDQKIHALADEIQQFFKTFAYAAQNRVVSYIIL